MMSREDCIKWLTANGYDAIYMEDLDLAGMLHEFSKSTVGHGWVDQGFRAEEEKQKAAP